MKILVCVKRVLDPYVKVRLTSDRSGVDLANSKMSINPFDEIAVEAAIQWQEQGVATDTVAVTVGTASDQEVLRTALAMGIDRGLHIETPHRDLTPRVISKLLHQLALREQPEVILMGKQSIDGDHNQTGQMLAARLDWPQGTFASKLVWQDHRLQVTREVDGGLQTVALDLPAVVTTDLRLNQPRYASLPNIMKAKQKPLEVVPFTDLGVALADDIQVLQFEPPPPRSAGVRVDSVDALLQRLRQDKVIAP